MAPRKKRNSIKKSGVLENKIHKTPKKSTKGNGKNEPNKNDLIRESINQHSALIDITQKNAIKNRRKRNKPDKKNCIQEPAGEDNVTPSRGQRTNYSRKSRTGNLCPVPNLEFVVDESVLDEDFIPLSVPMNVSKEEGEYSESSRTASETVVCNYTSDKVEDSVIVVDDDDDCNSVSIEEIKDSIDCESINDSVQIITNSNDCEDKNCNDKNLFTLNISPSKRRKFSDSIEILDSGDVCNNPSKTKSRNRGNVESSSVIPNVIQEPHNSDSIVFVKKSRNRRYFNKSSTISNTVMDISDDGETQNNQMQDDDIIIVDSVDKNSKDCVILNNPVPAKSKWKKTNSITYPMVDNNFKPVGNKPPFSHVYQDTVGNVQKKTRYKSFLSSISNQDSDPNVSYHNVYGNNMYNPNSVEKTGLRPVIIDGSNVAFGHGGNHFSVRGIEICIKYFVKRGHNVVIAFVPLFRRSEVSDTDRKILDDLQSKRQLAFTPSRFLHGRRVTSYDDRFIVQCAAELGGIIVSTDNYRDLVSENEAWRETIEKRLLMFTWVGDILMFPDDPNGRGGPRLMEFLRFP